MSSTSALSFAIYCWKMAYFTFKFHRNFPVQILEVTMKFMAIAGFKFLFRTQGTRLLFSWKYQQGLWRETCKKQLRCLLREMHIKKRRQVQPMELKISFSGYIWIYMQYMDSLCFLLKGIQTKNMISFKIILFYNGQFHVFDFIFFLFFLISEPFDHNLTS